MAVQIAGLHAEVINSRDGRGSYSIVRSEILGIMSYDLNASKIDILINLELKIGYGRCLGTIVALSLEFADSGCATYFNI